MSRAADIARLLTTEDQDRIIATLSERGESAALRLEGILLAQRRREEDVAKQGQQLELYPEFENE